MFLFFFPFLDLFYIKWKYKSTGMCGEKERGGKRFWDTGMVWWPQKHQTLELREEEKGKRELAVMEKKPK